MQIIIVTDKCVGHSVWHFEAKHSKYNNQMLFGLLSTLDYWNPD